MKCFLQRINFRECRDILRFVNAIVFAWLYIPHLCILFWDKKTYLILKEDVMRHRLYMSISPCLKILYFIHNDRFFRTLFYHRIGPIKALLIGWWRPGDKYFEISKTTDIGPGAYFAHPFSTVINAKSIGKNFSCRHITTIGNKNDGKNDQRPVIGDFVTLGVNVSIIGPVRIGNNVIIGAGSVVVNDIPDNCVAVGNPAKFIKALNNRMSL
ncbi:serine acetyltransferase [uncultured Alistipes sp.]|uniref:serine acetyltransferase n=1 Tax=uncultured Alistipes sp. TaxID=538949 RepID=UPI0026063CE6|nr:serine acetyltransferase [uncultured Alistipes sp.]